MDVAFSDRSTNGVQNKVIKAKFDELNSDLTTLAWNTSTDGFTWTKFPNGFIYAYKRANVSSGTSKSNLYTASYYGTGDFSISDIPFTREVLASGDLLGSFMTNLKLECACTWDFKTVKWALFTDNPSSTWNAKIVLIGF